MTDVVSSQVELDAAIDRVLDVLEASSAQGEELDPLATILTRLRERGSQVNLEEMPPMMRMLLGGML